MHIGSCKLSPLSSSFSLFYGPYLRVLAPADCGSSIDQHGVDPFPNLKLGGFGKLLLE
jgi:hypothetical protein